MASKGKDIGLLQFAWSDYAAESVNAVTIVKVEIDDKGWLRLYPAAGNYDFIYRAAIGVDWDQEGKFLHARKPVEWTYHLCFRQIVAAVASEYGDSLEIGSQTEWVQVSDDLRKKLRSEIN